MAIETEIKLKITDVQAVAALLAKQGFMKIKERYFEDNVLFDYPTDTLRARGCGLRVRTVGGHTTLTFKGPAKVNAKFKSREEIETAIADGEALETILARIGLVPVFRYQKYRTEYARDPQAGRRGGAHGLLATIDETPIGAYLELEGEESVLPSVIAQLGYRETDFIKSTYATLYKCHCEVNGLPVGDMVFS